MQQTRSASFEALSTISAVTQSQAVADPLPKSLQLRPPLYLVPATLCVIAGLALVSVDSPGFAIPFFLGGVCLAGRAIWQAALGIPAAIPSLETRTGRKRMPSE